MRKLTQNEQTWVDATLEKVAGKMVPVTERNRDRIPYTTIDGRFDDKSGDEITWWTNGFWGGEMWQLYKLTDNEMFREEAIKVEEKLDRVLMISEGLDHDNGFKWLPTSVIHYRLEKNSDSLNRAMLAAGNMAGRFNLAGNFIRAWNNWDDVDRRGFAIIDCMMNLPLLYWATLETTDPRFKMMAVSHADTAMKTFVREDGSVNHIVVFDPFTGEMKESLGGQGYGVGSSWTRGQSWGIYGFALSYRYTGDKKYLETSKKIADYVLSAMPESYLVPIDYRQPADVDLEDSTAAAITASGLIELAGHLDGEEADKYLDAAIKLLKTLDEKRITWSLDTDNLLNNCAVDYHGTGHNMSIIYGDYYFIEAVMKLAGKALKIF
jgi:unsaturated chondroitin disaccharide hydrolase